MIKNLLYQLCRQDHSTTVFRLNSPTLRNDIELALRSHGLNKVHVCYRNELDEIAHLIICLKRGILQTRPGYIIAWHEGISSEEEVIYLKIFQYDESDDLWPHQEARPCRPTSTGQTSESAPAAKPSSTERIP